jgi:hypothetical protein
MPVRKSKDLKGPFFQYGHHGKKYYFTTQIGMQRAYHKALKQQIAAHIKS